MISSLKLTSNTPLGKEQLKKINIIIQSLLDNNDSFQFRQPVDWKNLGLTDYPIIVKNPNDLGTVKKKILNMKYRNVEEALQDIQLIWDNCKVYNQAGTWIYNLAQKLQRQFKKMVKNYLPTIQILVPGVNPTPVNPPQKSQPLKNVAPVEQQQFEQPAENEQISYHEKLRFSNRIKNLSQEDLGKIVSMIQVLCSEAFKEVDKERSQIIVDNIDPESFQKINEKIDELSEVQDKVTKKIKI